MAHHASKAWLRGGADVGRVFPCTCGAGSCLPSLPCELDQESPGRLPRTWAQHRLPRRTRDLCSETLSGGLPNFDASMINSYLRLFTIPFRGRFVQSRWSCRVTPTTLASVPCWLPVLSCGAWMPLVERLAQDSNTMQGEKLGCTEIRP